MFAKVAYVAYGIYCVSVILIASPLLLIAFLVDSCTSPHQFVEKRPRESRTSRK